MPAMEPLRHPPGSRKRKEALLVATHAWREWSDRIRARGLRVAGIAIIVLGAGAALLPAGKTIPSAMIGGLLIASGLIETVAGSLRREARLLDMAAGIVTALAGLLFILNPETHFFPTVVPIIGWLIVRSLILAAAATETNGSVRRWTAISAVMDFLLAVLLITGLSTSTLVVSLFGPTRELVASFAWVLAASFVVNGLMLLEVASSERDASA
jgi:uncharacterized membrane protein HdeD (DUF308 family)